MVALLARHEMPFQFWAGTRGASLTPETVIQDQIVTQEFFDVSDQSTAVQLNKVGCAMSHRNLWLHYLEHFGLSEKPLLVLEDDVDFDLNEALGPTIEKLAQGAPAETDIVYLGYTAEADDCARHSELFHEVRRPRGMFAYLIWNQGIKKALDAVFPMTLPIDELMSRAIQRGALNALSVKPAMAVHRDLFESTIWRSD